jgi:hypothetical protein
MGNSKSNQNDGVITNNVEIELQSNRQLLVVILLIILLIIQLSSIIINAYYKHRRNLRKRYLAQSVTSIA